MASDRRPPTANCPLLVIRGHTRQICSARKRDVRRWLVAAHIASFYRDDTSVYISVSTQLVLLVDHVCAFCINLTISCLETESKDRYAF